MVIVVLVGIYAGPRLWTTVRFAGTAHVPKLDGDFGRIEMLRPAEGSEITRFYRGLPHNFFDGQAFLRAVWLSPTRSFHGYRFEFGKWKPSPEFRAVAESVLTRKASFVPYHGPKMCGGFHADFLAEFKGGRRTGADAGLPGLS